MRLIRLILTLLLSVALTFTGAVATAAAHCDESTTVSHAGHHGHAQHDADGDTAHQHDHAASGELDDGSSVRTAGSCSHCAFCQSCASPTLVSLAPQVALIETGALEKPSFTPRVTQFFADFPYRPPRAALA